MIRQLKDVDYKALMEFVQEEEEINLYIIGYIKNYGLSTAFLHLWGEFDSKDQLKAVLMKYYNDCVFYAREEFDGIGFSNILHDLTFQVLAGKKSIVEKLGKIYPFSSKTDTHFCKLQYSEEKQPNPLESCVKKMEADSLDGVIELYDSIEEFENNEVDNTSLRQRIADQCGRGYYIEINSEVAAAVQTTAEYEKAAMVVSVAANPKYRRKGYTTACMLKLCSEVQKEGKQLFLYYYNEAAGRIYHDMGFVKIAEWTRYGK